MLGLFLRNWNSCGCLRTLSATALALVFGVLPRAVVGQDGNLQLGGDVTIQQDESGRVSSSALEAAVKKVVADGNGRSKLPDSAPTKLGSQPTKAETKLHVADIDQIVQVIALLASEDYQERESATALLIKLGDVVVDPLTDFCMSADAESQWRACMIFEQLAISSDIDVTERVLRSLTKLVSAGKSEFAATTQQLSTNYAKLRSDFAINKIKQLGGLVSQDTDSIMIAGGRRIIVRGGGMGRAIILAEPDVEIMGRIPVVMDKAIDEVAEPDADGDLRRAVLKLIEEDAAEHDDDGHDHEHEHEADEPIDDAPSPEQQASACIRQSWMDNGAELAGELFLPSIHSATGLMYCAASLVSESVLQDGKIKPIELPRVEDLKVEPQVEEGAIELEIGGDVVLGGAVDFDMGLLAPPGFADPFSGSDYRPGVSVVLGKNWVGGVDEIKYLAEIANLNSLTLEDFRIEDGVVDHLAKIPSLTSLSIVRSVIDLSNSTPNRPQQGEPSQRIPLQIIRFEDLKSSQGISNLCARFPEIVALQMDRSNLDDEALFKEISKVEKLSALNLSQCKVEGKAFAHLRELKTLQSLNIHMCEFSAADLFELTKARPELTVACQGRGMIGIYPANGETRDLGGCEISTVAPGSGAEKAGIVPGDIIVEVDGFEIRDFPTLTYSVAGHAENEVLKVTVKRNGKPKEFKVKLSARSVIEP
jgi:PDZ domain